ncbi:MAG: hypothetical protein JSV87_04260 [Candidatus Bathyarchaeota archaeon]|nr:MAG: hypothetical protein JSV87_04260 [Candidatus Bathyarchaeota archaeon]
MQNCIKCGKKTAVYDSRLTVDGDLRRKRKCPSCGFRYATIEVLDDIDIAVRGPRKLVETAAKPPEVVQAKRGTAQPAKKLKKKEIDDDMYEEYDHSAGIEDVFKDLGIGDFT